MRFSIFFLSLSFLLVACSDKPLSRAEQDEHLIGVALASISPMASPGGVDSTQVAIYDETIRKVHHFDLENPGLIKTFEVQNNAPKVKHFELLSQNNGYIVDLSFQNLSIYDPSGQALHHNPLNFQGKPVSGAFVPSRGSLVIYDDLSSVGLLKMDNDGRVSDSWVSGPVVSGRDTLSAGDMNSDGDLILALTNGGIRVFDVSQSVAQKAWVPLTVFDSGLANILWLAPIAGTNLVMVRNSSKIALIDMGTNNIVSEFSMADYTVEKYSKMDTPHILLRKASASRSDRDDLIVVYAEGNLLKSKTLHLMKKSILSSRLNLTKDTWTLIDTTYSYEYRYRGGTVYDYSDFYRENRELKRYRFSDLLAQKIMGIGTEQTQLSQNFLFSLFPSKLGYATRYNINNGEKIELKRFNMGHIH